MEITPETVLETLSKMQKDLKILLASEQPLGTYEEAYSEIYRRFRK